MYQETRRRLRRRGMNLIEIMIVVVIMAMIAGMAGMAAMHLKVTADLKLARTTAQSIAQAADVYRMNAPGADCPTVTTLSEAHALKRGTDPDDPWGQAYVIECADTDVNVRSAGPDKVTGTEDDIALF